jgi:hypothetical protein
MDPDPQPHYFAKPDPDPHQSQKSGLMEARPGAVKAHN